MTWVRSLSSCLLKGGITEPKARTEWSRARVQTVMKCRSESSLPSDTGNLRLQPNTAICKVQAGEPCHWVTNRKRKSQNKSRFCMFVQYSCTCLDAEVKGQLQLSFPRHYQPCLLRYSLSWAWSSLRTEAGRTESPRNDLSCSVSSLPAYYVGSGDWIRSSCSQGIYFPKWVFSPECFKETSDHSQGSLASCNSKLTLPWSWACPSPMWCHSVKN